MEASSVAVWRFTCEQQRENTMDYFAAVALLSLYVIGRFKFTNASITLEVSSPGEVKENGLLVFMCQIWNLDSAIHNVQLSREVNGIHQSLTWNDNYETFDDEQQIEQSERMYLAKRQQEDTSIIYFLSILDITKEDTGDYFCQVIQTTGGLKEYGSESIHIAVQYTPSEIYPECTPHPAPVLDEGISAVFNCTSEQANPDLTIRWHRSNKDIPVFVQHSGKDIVYSELTLTPTSDDNGAIFFCQLTSSAFPDFIQTCFVGPVTVNPDKTKTEVQPSAIDILRPVAPTNNHNPNEDINTKQIPPNVQESSDCSTKCLPSKETSWVIPTASAVGITAAILLLLDIILIIKVYSTSGFRRKHSGLQSEFRKDDIYVELPQTGGQSRLYMTLEPGKGGPRSNNNQQQSLVPIPSHPMFVRPNMEHNMSDYYTHSIRK